MIAPITTPAPTPAKKRRHRPIDCPSFTVTHEIASTPEDDAMAFDGLLLLVKRGRENRLKRGPVKA